MSELWRELHTNAYNYKGNDDSAFLAAFAKKIPLYMKGKCSCHEYWYKWIRLNPVIYGNNKEYFAWTVRAHNDVNRKLGKPEMSLEYALKLYFRGS